MNGPTPAQAFSTIFQVTASLSRSSDSLVNGHYIADQGCIRVIKSGLESVRLDDAAHDA